MAGGLTLRREVRAELGRTQEARGACSRTQNPAGEAQGTSQMDGHLAWVCKDKKDLTTQVCQGKRALGRALLKPFLK